MRRAHATPLGVGTRPPRQPIMPIMSRQGVMAAATNPPARFIPIVWYENCRLIAGHSARQVVPGVVQVSG